MSSGFWEKVRKTDGCWEWTGLRDTEGYGLHHGVRKKYLAHRVSYAMAHGNVVGLDLDHLCRNRACVRPDHLEAVTHRENCRRGNGWAGVNARKTHCIHGHEFTPENTKIVNTKWQTGGRQCRECNRRLRAEHDKRRAIRRKERKLAAGWVPFKRTKPTKKREKCVNGHPYEGKSLIDRRCRICRRATKVRYRKRLRIDPA